MIRTRSRRTTERVSRPALVFLPRILSCLAVVLAFAAGAPSLAAPVELKAKVVWVRDNRIYVASAESLALQEGDLLRFRAGKKEVATGTVVDIHDAAMVVASLASGSFAKQKKLEKLRILAERPALQRYSYLRVGCPSPSRPSLLFACDSATIGASLPSGAYRADTLGERWYRFVRHATVPLDAPWPDTLYVRTFDESPDEEIALERGELDVAVFWPGELSAHIRKDARWKDFLYGVRSKGYLFASSVETEAFHALDAATTQGALDALNRSVFRNDVAPWSGSTVRDSVNDATPRMSQNIGIHFEVDRAIPESMTLERLLDQDAPSGVPGPRLPIRIFYSSVEVTAHGPVSPEIGLTPLSPIRCPVVSNAKLRKTITALGPNAFADLLGCGSKRVGPR